MYPPEKAAAAGVYPNEFQLEALRKGLDPWTASFIQTPIQLESLEIVISRGHTHLRVLSIIVKIQYTVLEILIEHGLIEKINSLTLSEFVNEYQVGALSLGLLPEYAFYVTTAAHYNALKIAIVERLIVVNSPEMLEVFVLQLEAIKISESRDNSRGLARHQILDIRSKFQILAFKNTLLSITQSLLFQTQEQYEALLIAIKRGLVVRRTGPLDKISQIKNQFQLKAFAEGASLKEAILIQTQRDYDKWKKSLEPQERPSNSPPDDDNDDENGEDKPGPASRLKLCRGHSLLHSTAQSAGIILESDIYVVPTTFHGPEAGSPLQFNTTHIPALSSSNNSLPRRSYTSDPPLFSENGDAHTTSGNVSACGALDEPEAHSSNLPASESPSTPVSYAELETYLSETPLPHGGECYSPESTEVGTPPAHYNTHTATQLNMLEATVNPLNLTFTPSAATLNNTNTGASVFPSDDHEGGGGRIIGDIVLSFG